MLSIEDLARRGRERSMNRDDVALGEEPVQRNHPASGPIVVAARRRGDHVQFESTGPLIDGPGCFAESQQPESPPCETMHRWAGLQVVFAVFDAVVIEADVPR